MKCLLVMLLFFSLSSCCTKEGCIYAPQRPLVFQNFPSGALDSVWIYRLDAINNFTVPVDSLLVNVRKDDDSVYHFTSYQFSVTKPGVYNISIPKAGKEYLITDMRFKKTKDCNSCFPARPRSATYNKFVGYNINGVKKDADYIEITY